MIDTAVRADETASVRPASSAGPHPLDPATAAEYLAGRDIMAAAGLLAEPVRFAYYGLEEPPKDEVLAGRATDRQLRAFLVNTGTGESTDVVVSLTHTEVVSARRLDPGSDGQMPILDSDFAAVDEITKADPQWRAAMARRGYHDVSTIQDLPDHRGRVRGGRRRPAADGPRARVRPGPRARPGLGAPHRTASPPTWTWWRRRSSRSPTSSSSRYRQNPATTTTRPSAARTAPR